MKKRAPIPRLPSGSFLVDSHCHLDMQDYQNDLSSVLKRSLSHGVIGVVTIGIDLRSSQAAVDLAKGCKHIRAAVGLHPHDAGDQSGNDLGLLAQLAAQYREEVVAYGEIGLDYAKMYAKAEVQRSVFIKQLGIAKELALPVIIHDRDAHEDCLEIIEKEGPFEHGGIMHCFSGNLELAKKLIDLNFMISIPGIVTFKNAHDLQEVARQIPLDVLVLETDGPFLAPVPYRGKRNEPSYTLYTAQAIASLRHTSLGEIAEKTTANACRLFNYSFPQAEGITGHDL